MYNCVDISDVIKIWHLHLFCCNNCLSYSNCSAATLFSLTQELLGLQLRFAILKSHNSPEICLRLSQLLVQRNLYVPWQDFESSLPENQLQKHFLEGSSQHYYWSHSIRLDMVGWLRFWLHAQFTCWRNSELRSCWLEAVFYWNAASSWRTFISGIVLCWVTTNDGRWQSCCGRSSSRGTQ